MWSRTNEKGSIVCEQAASKHQRKPGDGSFNYFVTLTPVFTFIYFVTLTPVFTFIYFVTLTPVLTFIYFVTLTPVFTFI
jgi:hypothetical protein